MNKRSPQRKDVTVFMSSEDDCVKWREGLFCIAKSAAANSIRVRLRFSIRGDYGDFSCQKILNTTLGGSESFVLWDSLGGTCMEMRHWICPRGSAQPAPVAVYPLQPLDYYYCTFLPRRTSNWRLMTWSQPQMTRWLLWTNLPTSPW